MAKNLLYNLFDWKQFELFVRDIYESDANVIVEHDVTETGKSGASRQIDVKVTQNSALHSYVTIIECKFWNKSIERTTVDIVAAAIEDLNASKGAIFTTVGYQQGAEAYAKSKNIDIFVVRELFDEEWGKPGRKIQLFLDIISGQMSKVHFPNAQALLIVEEQPEDMNLEIQLSKENSLDSKFNLYSCKNGDDGRNLVAILAEIHGWITRTIHHNLKGNSDLRDQRIVITTDVSVDISGYEFRQLRNKYAAVNLDKMELRFVTMVSNSEMNFDRSEHLDYALVVQNYISDQRYLASKRKDEASPTITNYLEPKKVDGNDVLVNGSTLTVFSSHWVGVDIENATRVGKTDPIYLKIVDGEVSGDFRLVQEPRDHTYFYS